jgi:predicted PurR-regulated permease PerM
MPPPGQPAQERLATVAARRSQQRERAALAVLVGLAFVVVAWMAAPLLVGLALGTVMGFTAQPLHARLTRGLRQRRRLASAVTTLLGGLVMAGGGAMAIWLVMRELVAAVELVRRVVAGQGPALFGPRATRVLQWLGLSRDVVLERLQGELGRAANLAAQAAGLLLQTSAGLVLTLVVALWTMYSVLVDWAGIERHLERLLPLERAHTQALVHEFRSVGRAAFEGTIAGAAIQGCLAWIGFAAVGVPQPVTWAALLAVLSFVPVVGVPIAWVPAAVWLLTTGHVARALLLTAWSLLFVMALNDYVIRPRLVGGKGNAHPLLMLVGLLGGISVFGVAGVIVGPVIMSLFVASARIYERERDLEVTSDERAASPSPPARPRPRRRRAPRRSRPRGRGRGSEGSRGPRRGESASCVPRGALRGHPACTRPPAEETSP